MRIAVTGATGFVGRELVNRLIQSGHQTQCWYREGSDRSPLNGFSEEDLTWIPGQLGDHKSIDALIDGCDAVVHSGLWRSTMSFQSNAMDLVEYARINVLGSLELMQAAVAAEMKRFVYVSTCAVHDHILSDRPLDEAHPLWANSHYGAHKAAVEKFVHSYGLGEGFPICAVRPTGVYGVTRPITNSKWYSLVQNIAQGKTVEVNRGGKEVHVADVAKAIELLLNADGIHGQAYSCYDRYISEYDVATMAKELTGSDSQIIGEQMRPKNNIDNSKIKALGMEFGGTQRLRATLQQMIEECG